MSYIPYNVLGVAIAMTFPCSNRFAHDLIVAYRCVLYYNVTFCPSALTFTVYVAQIIVRLASHMHAVLFSNDTVDLF